MKTILTNGIVVTMNPNRDWYPDGYVYFDDNRIFAAGPMEEIAGKLDQLAQEGAVIRDVDRAIVMPGMVNTHSHLGMVPFRGLGDDCKDRLRVFLLPMEQKAMNAELSEVSSRFAICEMLLSGVTTVLDMYYYENVAARAMDELGIRGIAGQTVIENDACDFKDVEDALAYGEELMETWKNHPRVSGTISPHGTTTCSPKLLQRICELDHKYQAPFTLHTAEMDYESAMLKEQYGCTPIAFLDRLGVLDENTLAAHCIRLEPEDIELLREKKACVAHCIGSNTKAAKGVAPVLKMLEEGVTVGLGTDGPSSGNTLDLFVQMRFCANFHKNENRNRSAMPAEHIVAMATIGGARALGLDHITGSLEPGKEADIVVVETSSPNMFPVYEPYSTLVYSVNPSNVQDVYVAGTQVVKDKLLLTADYKAIRTELKEQMNRTAFKEMNMLL
jgi:cytosine/adenosine deaminase-related metal-dependent hydrolase